MLWPCQLLLKLLLVCKTLNSNLVKKYDLDYPLQPDYVYKLFVEARMLIAAVHIYLGINSDHIWKFANWNTLLPCHPLNLL